MSLCRLDRDERGSSIIEVGFLLPILLLLSLGAMDMSLAFAAKLDLEQAAQRTSDLALGKIPKNSLDTVYLKNEAVAAAQVQSTDVTINLFLECDSVKQSTFSAECPTGKPTARFVEVVIRRQYVPLFKWSGLIGTNIFPDPVTIKGDSLVRFQ